MGGSETGSADKGYKSHTATIALVCFAVGERCSSLGSGALEQGLAYCNGVLEQWSSFGARSGFGARATFTLDSYKYWTLVLLLNCSVLGFSTAELLNLGFGAQFCSGLARASFCCCIVLGRMLALLMHCSAMDHGFTATLLSLGLISDPTLCLLLHYANTTGLWSSLVHVVVGMCWL
ncbi:hypothetical protein U1Q18_036801 [Sarracenia purpurea var. burkii]